VFANRFADRGRERVGLGPLGEGLATAS
jgi:hypothetical protein